MQNLASQNEAINGMIRVIERVADQTKMLALNATIEASPCW
jgi:methyl-accepting chemotaxis protein